MGNGEVSSVSAKSRQDACFLLHEFAEVELEDLHPVTDFMLSLKLTEDRDLEVSEMGEDTQELFDRTIYPVLFEAKMKVLDADQATSQVKRRIIREAVQAENNRLAGTMKQRSTETPEARRLQKDLGMSASVAECFAKSTRVKSDEGGK